MIEAFLRHRREVVTRRTLYELRKARERAHVLEGLVVALANIDQVIELIKKSPTPNDARVALCARLWAPGAVAEMLARAGASATRPEDLAEESGLERGGLPAVLDSSAGDPRSAAAAPDRPGAGQDLYLNTAS